MSPVELRVEHVTEKFRKTSLREDQIIKLGVNHSDYDFGGCHIVRQEPQRVHVYINSRTLVEGSVFPLNGVVSDERQFESFVELV